MSLAKRELRPPPVLTQDSQGPQTVIPVQAIIIRSDPVHSSGDNTIEESRRKDNPTSGTGFLVKE
jgi:hypothetical protein